MDKKVKVDNIYIHHSATDRDVQPEQFEMINLYHKQKWDFESSLGYYGGYNYLIEPNGDLKQYRADGEEQAAQYGHNFDTLSVCLAGNFEIQFPTLKQQIRLRSFLTDKLDEYGLEPEDVMLHREVKATACPGKNVTRTYILKLIQDQYFDGLKVAILKKLIKLYKKLTVLLWKKSKDGLK